MVRVSIIAALIGLAVPLSASAQAAATSPAASPCTAPEHSQFDFWVGRWDVTPTGKTNVVARSLIEKVYQGCGIRENWMPNDHADGGSLNIYMPAEKMWIQDWIDAGGTRGEFRGGYDGKSMVIAGDWVEHDGAARHVRITYTRQPDGSVRQFGEATRDGGRTWRPEFDLTYHKATS